MFLSTSIIIVAIGSKFVYSTLDTAIQNHLGDYQKCVDDYHINIPGMNQSDCSIYYHYDLKLVSTQSVKNVSGNLFVSSCCNCRTVTGLCHDWQCTM